MRYTDLCAIIETAAHGVGYVNSTFRGSPYNTWNNTEVQYVSVCYDLQAALRNENLHTYQLMLYAADRLTEGENNETQALDASEAVIDVIVAALRDSDGVLQVAYTTLTPFVQHDGFADNLGGYYTTLDIDVIPDINNC